MKLATLKDGSPDGRLVVVSRDLTRCSAVGHVAPTLQRALDDWDALRPRLEEVARGLENGTQPEERFHERDAASPLPRAYQWADGSAYLNHVELVRRARGAALPDSFLEQPLMYQGGSDAFLAPREPIRFPVEAFATDEAHGWGIDFEGEVAVVTGAVPMGADEAKARESIRLVALVNDVSLRALVPGELAKGFGFFQSKPASAFSPVALTPDELGDAWTGTTLGGVLRVDLNGRPFGRADAGEGMTFDFGRLIAHAARTRALGAGTLIGSGTVSNKDEDGSPGRPVADGGRGYSCIAEMRVIEKLAHGEARTRFMAEGDTVRIEMLDAGGRSIFGAIEQRVERAD